MKQKKKTLSPVSLVDALLHHEQDIRRAVDEVKKEFSFLAVRDYDGAGGRGGISDRTAGAALTLAEGLSCVDISEGRAIRKPEEWLSCFDAVREQAKECQRPEMIFDEWAAWYEGKRIVIDYSLAVSVSRNIRDWIRYRVLMEAKKRGLVTFDEEAIVESIENGAEKSI